MDDDVVPVGKFENLDVFVGSAPDRDGLVGELGHSSPAVSLHEPPQHPSSSHSASTPVGTSADGAHEATTLVTLPSSSR